MLDERLKAHLATGATTVCRCWAVTRADGQLYGFTDHDVDLDFEGITFRADTGLTARALHQSTGLSVDNAEAVGVLSHASVREEDIMAGRFDGAEVLSWLVNWADTTQRTLQFRGSLGEIRREGGAFHAELRGLAEALNQPQGRVFQAQCPAVLGDGECGFDLTMPGYLAELDVEQVTDNRVFSFAALEEFDDRWFEGGRLEMLTGAAHGLVGLVKNHRMSGDGCRLELWQELRAEVRTGDRLRIVAGCDKRVNTCKLKFNNFKNFRGFPHIPGEDWLMSAPIRGSNNDGGSRHG